MRTCVIFKPDAVAKRLYLPLQHLILESPDLAIIDQYQQVMLLDDIAEFYPHGVGQPWMEGNVKFLMSGPSVVCMIEGEDAVARCRRLALEIRDLFQTKNPRNLMHASDSPVAAQRELRIWFPVGATDDYSSE